MSPDPLERLRRIQFFWEILGKRECALPTADLLTLFENAARFGGTTVETLLTEEESSISRWPRHEIRRPSPDRAATPIGQTAISGPPTPVARIRPASPPPMLARQGGGSPPPLAPGLRPLQAA